MPDPQQNATATSTPPPAPPDPANAADNPETFTQRLKRNLSFQPDVSQASKGPGHEFDSEPSPQKSGEELYEGNFGSPLERAYHKTKNFISEHEDKLSEKVLQPFREGLDRIGDELEEAGSTGHTRSGGQLTGPTRALVSGAGAALKSVPVGKDVKSTVQAIAVPPELGPEGRELNAAERVKPNLEGIEHVEISPAPKPGAKAPNLEGIEHVEISPAPGKRAAKQDEGTRAKIPSDSVSEQDPEFEKWFSGSKVIDEGGRPLTVYHGTSQPFDKVDMSKGAQGVFWASSDRGAIERGESGAVSHKHIIPMNLDIKNPAGWDEYEKLTLDQIESQGHDGIILPNKDGSFDAIVFKPEQVRIKKATPSVAPKNPAHERLFAEATAALGQETKKTAAKTTLNASGESSASQEAINRAASEKSQGIKRYRIDSRSGKEIPLFGPDAVDAKVGPFDYIVSRDSKGQTVLDMGSEARPLRTKR